MFRSSSRRFVRWTAAAVLLGLTAASSAQALFPPPFYYPPVVITGDPDPEPPTPDLPPDPFTPPPETPCSPCSPCSCDCTTVRNTPEPATLVSGIVGLSLIGAAAWRRRNRK